MLDKSTARNAGIVHIGREGSFALNEVNALVPVFLKITEVYNQEVNALIARIEALPDTEDKRAVEYEEEINDKIKQWHLKVKKLGGTPRGLWLVDFDAGDGFYCWKYPEEEVKFWHSYQDSASDRIPLEVKSAPLD